jgi:spore coat polysaccharide biosynthesis protein SpsF (cytidylyltransferase family)
MVRLTLDTHEDYDYIKYVYDTLGDNPQTKDILELPRQRIVDRV